MHQRKQAINDSQSLVPYIGIPRHSAHRTEQTGALVDLRIPERQSESLNRLSNPQWPPPSSDKLADFAAGTQFDRLPSPVVDECKRILLDSIGVALAAVDEPKGRIGIEYGRLIGGSGKATIIGTADRVNLFGAAFANGELINALDMDAVLPPGHVTPYVLPGALAVGETLGVSGQALIAALAVAHEMSWRLGKAMDYLRDTQDGKVSPPPVYGYSSTVFGATAAIGILNAQHRGDAG